MPRDSGDRIRSLWITLSRRGNRGHGDSIQNLYRCAGDDDWIAVTIRNDDQWAALVELMGRPAWCTEDLATVIGRREHADNIDRRLQDWFAGQPLANSVEGLAAAGVPAAPVVSPSLVTENRQLRDRGFFEKLDHSSIGSALYPCRRLPCSPSGPLLLFRRRPWASTMVSTARSLRADR